MMPGMWSPSAIRSITSTSSTLALPLAIRLTRDWLKPSMDEAMRSWLTWSHLRMSRKAAPKSRARSASAMSARASSSGETV
ncbi:hypothetical protein UG55_105122 [Frankia sp. EI5c]|nr:hypothetical protein UG55_105122 [Frankia sp. EI5c]